MRLHSWPLVTIAIPTRNRDRSYLRETLSSAMAQTYANVEIVVSDNCSVDGTESFMRSIADPRIRYFRHDRPIDANENFNFCLEQAMGDYFLLLHDDDIIDHDFVEACLRAAQYGTDIGVIRTGTRMIDAGGTVLREVPNRVGGLSTEEFFRGWFAGRTTLYFCSTLFHTGRLRGMGGFDSPHHVFQDAFAIMLLAARYGRADVEEVQASFRRHASGRTFSTRVTHWCDDSLALLDVMCGLVSGGPDRKETVRREGLRFLAGLNYGRAAEARALAGRLAGYFVVFRKFNYQYVPNRRRVYQLFQGTVPYRAMRFAKQKLTGTVLLS